MDNEGVFSTKELDEQLHEDVKHIGLVDVTHSVAEERPFGVNDRNKSRSRVNRNHREDADDLNLDSRLRVVSEVLHDLIACNATGQDGKECAKVIDKGCMGGIKRLTFDLCGSCLNSIS